jgi:hypothetical protein
MEASSPSMLSLGTLLRDDEQAGKPETGWAISASTALRRIVTSLVNSASGRIIVDGMNCSSQVCEVRVTVTGRHLSHDSLLIQTKFESLSIDKEFLAFEFGGPAIGLTQTNNGGDTALPMLIFIPHVPPPSPNVIGGHTAKLM